MERYGLILTYAMPIFLVAILFEKAYGVWVNKDYSPLFDMISGVLSGLTNAVKDVLGLTITILSYTWLYDHIAIYNVQNTVWAYIIGFIVIDFYGYWTHRWAHEINFFWNKHAIHHSSEEFNLSAALRQSISTFFNIFNFLLIPAALLGVPPIIIATIFPIHLFLQFWYHTRHINRMSFLEHIIVTPSHHRVHHAMNRQYIDKNYGQIFIIWDKLFGTFQEELPEVPPVYGISRPVKTWNPITINTQHFMLMAYDSWHTTSMIDKVALWFKPTGWRPIDVSTNHPVAKVDDLGRFQKYTTWTSPKFTAYCLLQMAIILMLSFYFFGHLGDFSNPHKALVGVWIFLAVYALTALMDNSRWAWLSEMAKMLVALFLLFQPFFWTAPKGYLFIATIGYCLLSFVGSVWWCAYFVTQSIQRDRV